MICWPAATKFTSRNKFARLQPKNSFSAQLNAQK
jgi:hypothetical protein